MQASRPSHNLCLVLLHHGIQFHIAMCWFDEIVTISSIKQSEVWMFSVGNN